MRKYEIPYYLLIALSCFVGAILAGSGGFYNIIITLCYIYVALFSVLNVFIKKSRFSQTSQVGVKISFLFLCFILTFYMTSISDEMLFEHEFELSPESFEVREIDIKAESGGYLINIVFEIPHEDLIKVVNKIRLHQVDLMEMNLPHITKFAEVGEILMGQINQNTNRIICFSNAGERSYCHRIFLYDTKTGIAYYERVYSN